MPRKHTPEEAEVARLKRLEASRAWRKANAERERANGKAWRAANKEYHAARCKAWADANPDKVREKTRRWVQRHPEIAKQKTAAWRKRNPEWDRAKQARRRAVGDLTVSQVLDVETVCDGMCAYCLKPAAKRSIDHVLPIRRGGFNSPDNLVLACSRCNSAKRCRTPLEFMFGLPKLGTFR